MPVQREKDRTLRRRKVADRFLPETPGKSPDRQSQCGSDFCGINMWMRLSIRAHLAMLIKPALDPDLTFGNVQQLRQRTGTCRPRPKPVGRGRQG